MGMGRAALVVSMLVACGHEPVELTVVPETRCPTQICPSPKTEYVSVEAPECKEARKVLRFRNAKLKERMDECDAAGNNVVSCMRWVFGHYEDEAPRD